ncbi:acyl-CoA dehydrogenase family protein, partial [Neobacillus drentensis]
MNFDLTAEQDMIKRTIRQFADEEVAPGAIERDKTKQFPVEIFKKLAE